MPKEWMVVLPYGDAPLSELAAREMAAQMSSHGLVPFVLFGEPLEGTLGESGAV